MKKKKVTTILSCLMKAILELVLMISFQNRMTKVSRGRCIFTLFDRLILSIRLTKIKYKNKVTKKNRAVIHLKLLIKLKSLTKLLH